TTGDTGSLLSTHSNASYSPGVNPEASNDTVTSLLAPAAVDPLAGDTDSHGMSAGVSHGGGVTWTWVMNRAFAPETFVSTRLLPRSTSWTPPELVVRMLPFGSSYTPRLLPTP